MRTLCAILAPVLLLIGQANAAEASVAPQGTVACVSAHSMLRYADARDEPDRLRTQRLLNGACRPVDGKPYALLDQHNGVDKILVFSKPDDWETAEVFYTLDEMLQLE
jgi:hypothetical protein